MLSDRLLLFQNEIYKLIAVDLSKQQVLEVDWKSAYRINFTWNSQFLYKMSDAKTSIQVKEHAMGKVQCLRKTKNKNK